MMIDGKQALWYEYTEDERIAMLLRNLKESNHGAENVADLLGIKAGGPCPSCKATFADLEETRKATRFERVDRGVTYGNLKRDQFRCLACNSTWSARGLLRDFGPKGKERAAFILEHFDLSRYRDRLFIFSALRFPDQRVAEIVTVGKESEALKLLNARGERDLVGARVWAPSADKALQVVLENFEDLPWIPVKAARGRLVPEFGWHPTLIRWEELQAQEATKIRRLQAEDDLREEVRDFERMRREELGL